jgi:hypothetical protein
MPKLFGITTEKSYLNIPKILVCQLGFHNEILVSKSKYHQSKYILAFLVMVCETSIKARE